jgi:hypothetical protein
MGSISDPSSIASYNPIRLFKTNLPNFPSKLHSLEVYNTTNMHYTNFIIGLAALLTTVTGTFVVPINSSSTALTLSSGNSRFFYQADDLSIHEVNTLISPANGIQADVSLVPGNIVRENTPLACLIWPASAEDFGIVRFP